MRHALSLTLIACASAVLAQSSPPATQQLPKVILTSPAVGRSAPPSGPLNIFVGEKVQALPKGAEVGVLGRKTYGAFGGTNVWLQVQPPRASASSAQPAPIWIYGVVQEGTSVVPSGVVVTTK